MAITEQFPASKFRMVSMRELGPEQFEYHPIWSEFYDHDERDEIIEWGVDPVQLEAELARHHTGDEHAAYTVLKPYPLPERMRLYICAKFTTPDGVVFDGYVMDSDAFVFLSR